jgi:DNA-binding NarL/FixJ family response regulator
MSPVVDSPTIVQDGPAVPSPADVPLSDEDLQILRVLTEGYSMHVASARLHMSPRTLRRRIVDLCDRIGVDNQVQAVVWAIRRGHI